MSVELSFVLVAGVSGGRSLPAIPPAIYARLAGLGTAGVVAFTALADPAAGGGRRALHLLEARPLLGLGLVSYSFYLWKEPLIRLFSRAGITSQGLPSLAVNVVLHGASSSPSQRSRTASGRCRPCGASGSPQDRR